VISAVIYRFLPSVGTFIDASFYYAEAWIPTLTMVRHFGVWSPFRFGLWTFDNRTNCVFSSYLFLFPGCRLSQQILPRKLAALLWVVAAFCRDSLSFSVVLASIFKVGLLNSPLLLFLNGPPLVGVSPVFFFLFFSLLGLFCEPLPGEQDIFSVLNWRRSFFS